MINLINNKAGAMLIPSSNIFLRVYYVNSIFYTTTTYINGAGPSDVNPSVLSALARPTVGHLDPTFIGMMDEVKLLLQYVFKLEIPTLWPYLHQVWKFGQGRASAVISITRQ